MKKNNKKKIRRIFAFIALSIIFIDIFLFIYKSYFQNKLTFELKGEKKITILLNEEYKEKGYIAKYNRKDISKKVKVDGTVDTGKIGKYKITYKIKYKDKEKKITRIINVIEKTKPEITLKELNEGVKYIVGGEYNEIGYSATDNYDGDITDKVVVESNLNINEVGEYEIKYSVEDSSGNKDEKTRKIVVVDKPNEDSLKQGVAVLNYHFFYTSANGEGCNEGNCKDTSDFRKELDYLKENNFATLSMQEFRDWMYGVIEVPEKSVLITVDDGQLGTGKHNGNKLIPILEEYKMHATLFLISGWNSVENYKSDYLDIESHTHDMHTERVCSDMPRGAKLLCSTDEQVMYDLSLSITTIGSKKAFCFPFYAYNDTAIEQVKRAGFELAFIGGGYKATRKMDKYHIPRYQIVKTTSLETFKNYVN